MAAGRPRKEVNMDELAHFVRAGYTRPQLAEHFSVSMGTVANLLRRNQLRKLDNRTRISDAALDDMLRQTMTENPNWGEKMVDGYLRSVHINIPRSRLRASLDRVDREGKLRRKRGFLTRRRYHVAGPNAMWHIDGNHKLIRWRFVIHGGIDGFSRTVTFLKCSPNNKASTVLTAFREGVETFGIPAKVRSDRGMENTGVATFMLEQRGADSGAFITGRSVHNQRIERLWRDVTTSCTSKYKDCFVELEEDGELDVDNEIDLFCICYVFLGVINASLKEFRDTWNNHKIRTANNKSPREIWTEAVAEGFTIDALIEDDNTSDDSSEEEEDQEERVDVPVTRNPLTEEEKTLLDQNFSNSLRLIRTVEDGSTLYSAVRMYVRNIVNSRQ